MASRHSDLLAGTVFFLFGSAALAGGIFRAWRARLARRSVRWADLLLGRVRRQENSLIGEPLLESPLKQYEVLAGIFYGIVGLALAAIGVWLLLAGFGIGGPIYTPDAPAPAALGVAGAGMS